MIEFDGVSKVFPDGTVAVDDLTLTLPTGRISVFVGPSGCGKTTSLRMINRMIEASSGSIRLDGEDVRSRDVAVMRRSIGYVIQQAGLFPHLTIAENIVTVPRLMGVGRRKALASAGELMERVGLPLSLAKRYPVQLSGGQQQRVGVARALAADPPVLLMDEPFSAVDPVVRAELQDEFLRLQREIGKTIVLVTHDIDEAIKLGDNIAIFQTGGHLEQFAPPQEILENPVNEFVASFAGRDRGFRSLSFESAAALTVDTVASASSADARLELDATGRPLRWTTLEHHALPVGATFTEKDSLRVVTDAVISSPVGIAVRVDADGAADGIVTHESLFSQLTARRLERAAGTP
ncbi:ATP-binding cassette domain-containing protein [Rathayibacter sp. VKM Ac-2803]|uniref:ABC transporter ATP-binding protein n=1 Tax=unclassified Rathayibacter TaxID=2609250 RepID=UPI001358ABAD|nr:MULTISPECIES: ABC transporter ATP-binding protein [unclassified Rathayibacter]MWV48565.1 ATP-binding cassette domain-containing protein [Rathayibacter sp. VKM Ac-2803]MWV60097.1 ATP-binding cassette domain-containing protein [Rathayibacter sp. VKM Ac-2754]